MSVNFKDIKRNFFDPYLKYWIIFIIIMILYFGNNIRSYYTKTDSIIENLKNAEYVTNAVAINETTLITSKSLIENACPKFKSRFTYNRFFAFDDKGFYEVIPVNGDSVSNLIMLRMVEHGPKFKNYAIMQIDEPQYKINNRYYSPMSLNKFGKYTFKKSRLVGFRDKNFFLSFRNVPKNKKLEGIAVFDRSFLLQGIIREKNTNYENKRKQDQVLDSVDIQKTYLVNSANFLKQYLNSNKINYYTISKTTDLEKLKYNVEDALLNVVCVNRRIIRND